MICYRSVQQLFIKRLSELEQIERSAPPNDLETIEFNRRVCNLGLSLIRYAKEQGFDSENRER